MYAVTHNCGHRREFKPLQCLLELAQRDRPARQLPTLQVIELILELIHAPVELVPLFLREPDLRVQFVPLEPMLGRVVDEGADLRVERIALLDPLPRLVVQFVAAPAVPFRFLVFSLPLQLQLLQQGTPHASGWSGFARRRLPYKTSRPRSESPDGTGADNGVATSNSGRRISAPVLCPPTPRDAVSSWPERGDPSGRRAANVDATGGRSHDGVHAAGHRRPRRSTALGERGRRRRADRPRRPPRATGPVGRGPRYPRARPAPRSALAGRLAIP